MNKIILRITQDVLNPAYYEAEDDFTKKIFEACSIEQITMEQVNALFFNLEIRLDGMYPAASSEFKTDISNGIRWKNKSEPYVDYAIEMTPKGHFIGERISARCKSVLEEKLFHQRIERENKEAESKERKQETIQRIIAKEKEYEQRETAADATQNNLTEVVSN